MAWEEVYRGRKPYPCGKGEYEEVYREDDWYQHETRRTMLCPECRERYTYSGEVIGGYPGKEIERGWVLNSVLEAERDVRMLKVQQKPVWTVSRNGSGEPAEGRERSS